ncbi:MAG: phage holin family protein [Actinobacteria bacterium]|nr:phage holin family protein [Actinomycetota bacterium]
MIRLLISALIRLLANALGLIVAASVLDGMRVNAFSFIFAVVIFTLVELLLEPLLREVSSRKLPALRGSLSLVVTFLGLVITDLVSSGFSIHGLSTWLFATVLVWICALVAGIILPLILVKRAVKEH